MRRIKYIISISFILLLILFAYYLPRLVIIRNIECMSQYGPCGTAVAKAIESFDQANYKVTKKYFTSVLSQHHGISEYSLQYKYPDTVLVNVLENKARYGLRVSSEQNIYLIEEEGKIIGMSSTTRLPMINTKVFDLEIGQYVDEETLFALKIIHDMNHVYQITEGILDEKGVFFQLDSGNKVIFPVTGDREVLMGALGVIITSLNSEPQGYRIEIDLRFKNPVIKKV